MEARSSSSGNSCDSSIRAACGPIVSRANRSIACLNARCSSVRSRTMRSNSVATKARKHEEENRSCSPEPRRHEDTNKTIGLLLRDFALGATKAQKHEEEDRLSC